MLHPAAVLVPVVGHHLPQAERCSTAPDTAPTKFEERFWSGADLAGLFREVTGERRRITGIESIFEAGFREFARLRQRRQRRSAHACSKARSAACASPRTREIDRLEQNLEFLANVGSISPVRRPVRHGVRASWSRSRAWRNVKEATIAMVAPGISEALIATAMGLFAAIPAVWAYNRFATKVERISSRYDTFVEEFSSILQRQAHAGRRSTEAPRRVGRAFR